MSRSTKSTFICAACGYQTQRWLGRCPECMSWSSLEEHIEKSPSGNKGDRPIQAVELIPLTEKRNTNEIRVRTGISELDRVLGGGIVQGALIMIGGDPGIGKSTIMLQMLNKISVRQKSVYISGEESLEQIQDRAERIGFDNKNIFFLSETNIENMTGLLEKENPALVIIDSIQTVSSEEIDGIPGNSSQLRYCTAKLQYFAKYNNIPVFIVGHVTKDGSIAGPKIIEHMVDTVLYFEGDNNHDYRILRCIKNRFGAVNEIGIFQMQKTGLEPVSNPSELFLNSGEHDRQGTTVIAVMEGNRPLLVEVQALVTKTQFGMPQRTSTGFDQRRINLLLAVLEKKYGKPFGFHDVFIKTAGGLRIDEPAADLGICMALLSSLQEKTTDHQTVFIGEVGLNGELRGVSSLQERVSEAEKLGFKNIVIPRVKKSPAVKKSKLYQISKLDEVFNH
ncbi:MAG: DNA repair protein RadA [Calditrichaceae bacterium]